ncbi:hypothetical protein J6590_085910 [Homalodisca vitripennis]|nr:hypothetical protein J6590_085910 [Homalodisca vitripennis]
MVSRVVETSQAEESAALFRAYSTYRLQFIPYGDRPGRRQRKAQLCSGSTVRTGFNLFHMETDQVEVSLSHKSEEGHRMDGVETSQAEESAALFR